MTLFVIAVSLRKDAFAFDLLLPDFRDFYHTAITLGLFAVMIALIAVAAAMLRHRFPACWKVVHRAMLVVVIMGLIHGFLIGTETRYGLYELFYGSLMVSFLLAVILRWRDWRKGL